MTLSPSMLRAALEAQTVVVLKERMALQPDTAALIGVQPQWGDSLEPMVRRQLVSQLAQMNIHHPGEPRGRQPFWNGFLLRFGAAGIYNPFTGECNIDKGLPNLTKPYTLAHEFCHGYGFGDEGTCSFLAYLALSNSRDTFLKYTAELAFWRELASSYRKSNPSDYKIIWDKLPSGFQKDIQLIHTTIQQYPEYFEVFRVKAYDQYLKAQGIEEGINNYSKVVTLVLQYRMAQ